MEADVIEFLRNNKQKALRAKHTLQQQNNFSFLFLLGTIKQTNIFLLSKERQFESSNFFLKKNYTFWIGCEPIIAR